MKRVSPKRNLPELAAMLIRRHDREWAAGSRASLSFGLRRGEGYFLILRSPGLRSVRLASALLPTSQPDTDGTWRALSQAVSAPRSLIEAKYQYVVVPRVWSKAARKAVRGRRIVILVAEDVSGE